MTEPLRPTLTTAIFTPKPTIKEQHIFQSFHQMVTLWQLQVPSIFCEYAYLAPIVDQLLAVKALGTTSSPLLSLQHC